jgi:hypothetical protein
MDDTTHPYRGAATWILGVLGGLLSGVLLGGLAGLRGAEELAPAHPSLNAVELLALVALALR